MTSVFKHFSDFNIMIAQNVKIVRNKKCNCRGSYTANKRYFRVFVVSCQFPDKSEWWSLPACPTCSQMNPESTTCSWSWHHSVWVNPVRLQDCPFPAINAITQFNKWWTCSKITTLKHWNCGLLSEALSIHAHGWPTKLQHSDTVGLIFRNMHSKTSHIYHTHGKWFGYLYNIHQLHHNLQHNQQQAEKTRQSRLIPRLAGHQQIC